MPLLSCAGLKYPQGRQFRSGELLKTKKKLAHYKRWNRYTNTLNIGVRCRGGGKNEYFRAGVQGVEEGFFLLSQKKREMSEGYTLLFDKRGHIKERTQSLSRYPIIERKCS